MKHDILEEIVAHKKIELQHQKKAVPLHIMLGLASEIWIGPPTPCGNR